MWQPNRKQWRVIWPLAVLLVGAWPPAEGRSLGLKAVSWLADPTHALVALPAPLPMGLDDDGDAVMAHDALEAEYYRQYQSSSLTRLRMNLRDVGEPFDPTTERQLLVALGVLGALLVWRLERGKSEV